jgi:hypothetical protein
MPISVTSATTALTVGTTAATLISVATMTTGRSLNAKG